MRIRYLLLLLLVPAFLPAQTRRPAYLPDRDFEWIDGNCAIRLPDKRIFQKVEFDPRFTELQRSTFKARLSDLFDRLDLNEKAEGVIKIKLFFPLAGTLCITRIGIRQIKINEDQRLTLLEDLSGLGSFTPGRQQQADFSCTALLYLFIEDGNIVEFRAKNFHFSDDQPEGR